MLDFFLRKMDHGIIIINLIDHVRDVIKKSFSYQRIFLLILEYDFFIEMDNSFFSFIFGYESIIFNKAFDSIEVSSPCSQNLKKICIVISFLKLGNSIFMSPMGLFLPQNFMVIYSYFFVLGSKGLTCAILLNMNFYLGQGFLCLIFSVLIFLRNYMFHFFKHFLIYDNLKFN